MVVCCFVSNSCRYIHRSIHSFIAFSMNGLNQPTSTCVSCSSSIVKALTSIACHSREHSSIFNDVWRNMINHYLLYPLSSYALPSFKINFARFPPLVSQSSVLLLIVVSGNMKYCCSIRDPRMAETLIQRYSTSRAFFKKK
jgi:hypothetical protein